MSGDSSIDDQSILTKSNSPADWQIKYRRVLLRLLLLMGIPLSIYYALNSYRHDNTLAMALHATLVALYSVGAILTMLRLPARPSSRLIKVMVSIYFATIFTLHISLIQGHLVEFYSWFVFLPPLIFVLIGYRKGIVVAAVYLATLIVSAWVAGSGQVMVSVTKISIQAFIAAASAAGIGFAYEYIRARTHRALLDRHQRLMASQAQLEELNLGLEEEVERRTAALTRTNQQLQEEVTVRQQAQAELARSEASFRALFNTVSDFLYTHDLEGRFLETNYAFQQVTGYSEQELIGRHTKDLMPPGNRDQFDAYLAAIARSGYEQGMMLVRDKTGREFIAEYKNHLVRDDDGRPVLVRGSARDITERLQAEREKKRLADQLLRAQRLESVGFLAGGVAHGFNNIMTAIMGYSELALDGAREGRTSPEFLQEIISSANRGVELVRQILTFSRKVDLDRQPMAVNDIAERVARVAERSFPAGIRVERRLAGDLPPVLGDAVQIEQALANLVGNAGDAMPQGGTLTVATRLSQGEKVSCVACGQDLSGCYVVVSLSDTGSGMEEHVRQKMFDPFFTTKAFGKGTGLGLSTSLGIIRGHDGHVTCQTGPGQGTTFQVYLPLTPEEPCLETPAEPAHRPGLGQYVLLADGEEGARSLASAILTRAGYRVDSAVSGEEAVALYRGNLGKYALVILGQEMPGMTGSSALEEILAANPSARVVLVGVCGPAGVALPQGAAAGLTKPFQREALLQVMDQVLDRPEWSPGS